MVRRTTFICIGLSLLLFAFSYADDNVAVVLKVRRDVRITPTNQTRTVQAKRGSALQDGSKIETGERSFCALKFLDDKSLLRIRENSSCIIEGKKEQNKIEKNIFVQVGAFFADLFKPKGSFKVTTPTSVASIKGTKFWVIQRSPTKFIVTEGVIEVENETNKALVRAGQTAVVQSSTSEIEVYLTREGEIPSDEDQSKIGELDINFENEQGEEKILRIKFKE
jgi:hypothetical protein